MLNKILPKRAGKIQNGLRGYFLLTNEYEKSFSVHETTAMIWNYCDGRMRISEISEKLRIKLNIKESKRQFEDEVRKTIWKLNEFGLVIVNGSTKRSNFI